jgi:hypothetical protein
MWEECASDLAELPECGGAQNCQKYHVEEHASDFAEMTPVCGGVCQ